LGIGDWGLGPIPNPQSPIPILKILNFKYSNLKNIILFHFKDYQKNNYFYILRKN